MLDAMIGLATQGLLAIPRLASRAEMVDLIRHGGIKSGKWVTVVRLRSGHTIVCTPEGGHVTDPEWSTLRNMFRRFVDVREHDGEEGVTQISVAEIVAVTLRSRRALARLAAGEASWPLAA